MSVTNPLRDEIVCDGETWDVEHLTGEKRLEVLNKYNDSKNRFLFYPWGIYVTAYARRNLFTGILECGDDYIYSDTDSVKIKNGEDHKEYFKAYNDLAQQKLRSACKFHKIPFKRCVFALFSVISCQLSLVSLKINHPHQTFKLIYL